MAKTELESIGNQYDLRWRRRVMAVTQRLEIGHFGGDAGAWIRRPNLGRAGSAGQLLVKVSIRTIIESNAKP